MWETYASGFARWFHFLFGIMWIGLLYYFNFVQADALKAANADGTGAGITKHVLPRALFFFRWSAVGTWLMGAAMLFFFGNGAGLADAFALKPPFTAIGIGAWLGTIMLVNVWTFIWQNQKKVLGIVAATEFERGRARRIAFLASRVNTMLSIPMLFFMAAGFTHKAAFGL